MKTILLVDDDKDELIIFLEALDEVRNGVDFVCSYANGCSQASEMLKLFAPDYIFIDFNIPSMNGLEFISFINRQPTLKGTRFCLYSTFISSETEEITRELGATCIRKTTTIPELAENLKDFFAINH
jgi:CheY-like chemotaxis protein